MNPSIKSITDLTVSIGMFFSKNNNTASSNAVIIVRPPSALALALAEHDWTRAHNLLQGSGSGSNAKKLASRWSTLQGFFEGLKDASVLPLHQAASSQTTAASAAAMPMDLLHLLLTSYPAAIQQAESSYQRLPLHCACRTAADPVMIQCLLRADQDYIRQKNTAEKDHGMVLVSSCLQPDALGRLPLHYALSNGADPAVVEMLLQAAPAAAQGVDTRGWMPLHVAVSMGASLSVVQQIYQAYPTAIVMRTLQGSTPMRCLNKMVRHREQLKAFLKQARVEYEEGQGKRLGLNNSCISTNGNNSNNNINTGTRQLHRVASSPADVAVTATSATTMAIQNPFDSLLLMTTENDRPGVTRSSSHDGEGIPCLSPFQQPRKGRKRPPPPTQTVTPALLVSSSDQHAVMPITKTKAEPPTTATISTTTESNIITASVPSIMERPLPVRTAVLV